MQYAIVTGASRGLGEAVARQLIEKNVSILSIARNSNPKLKELAEDRNVSYICLPCDLSDPVQVEDVLPDICEAVFHEETHYVYLINNAGMIEPIERVGHLAEEMVHKHVQLNLTTPILLINRILNEANDRNIRTSIINITSGAAERSVYGWSVYSSTKAAINRFTETVALEQKENEHKVFAFSPGVMDTDMQEEIRSSSEEAFAEVDKFRQMKEEGTLRTPNEVASVLMDLMNQYDGIENGKVYKLYDLID